MNGSPQVTLRPAGADDLAFLRQVYAESRAAELTATGWTSAEKEAFCDSQFAAQDHHYRTYYPDCRFLVIERDGRPVGRLYRDQRDDEIRVVDLALLSGERGRGVGGHLLREIQSEAAAAGLAVRIHVERSNPARRLYDRLGFQMEEAGEVYDLLSWNSKRHP